jgi:diaminopimelate decarboxylase
MTTLAGPPGLDDAAIRTAVTEYGTPLYVYDLATIAERYGAFVATMPDRVTVCYALKANSSLGICRRLAELGCAADICSLGELATAIAAGFPMARSVFTGPGKTREELRAAVEAGVHWLVVESEGEAERLSRIAVELGRTQRVLARVHPAAYLVGDGLAIDSRASKFGIDEERAEAVLRRVAGMPGLQLEGIHAYTESAVLDASRLLATHTYVFELAKRLAHSGLPISVVDLGGGFGVPYRAEEAPLDLGACSRGLTELLASAPSGWRVIFEPGRFLTAESGVLAMRVVDVKDSGSKRYVIVDSGIHRIYRPLMAHANRQVRNIDGAGRPQRTVTIAGPLLSPQDVLIEDLTLPSPEVDDILVLERCGAYAYGHSLMSFSLHPTPAEVAVDGGRQWLLRRRGTPADFLGQQVAEPPAQCRPARDA